LADAYLEIIVRTALSGVNVYLYLTQSQKHMTQ